MNLKNQPEWVSDLDSYLIYNSDKILNKNPTLLKDTDLLEILQGELQYQIEDTRDSIIDFWYNFLQCKYTDMYLSVPGIICGMHNNISAFHRLLMYDDEWDGFSIPGKFFIKHICSDSDWYLDLYQRACDKIGYIYGNRFNSLGIPEYPELDISDFKDNSANHTIQEITMKCINDISHNKGGYI